MEILVCIKQVPDDSVEISLNSSTGKPNFDGVTQIVNAFDTYALEMATRLKEKAGGEITVVSIGDESVKNSLKNCLAVGADKAYLVKEEGAEELDPAGISKNLVKAKEEIENMVEEGYYDQWYENALVQMIFKNDFQLYYKDICDYDWTEVDCVSDLIHAKTIHMKEN